MTYTEAYDYIDNLLDKSGTAYFTDNEKNIFLDMAVMEYTKGLVNTLESDAQSMEKIAPLVVKSSSIAQSSGVAAIPSDSYHILRIYTAVGDYPVNIISHGEYAISKDDPFRKPSNEKPFGLLKGSNIEIFGNSSNIFVEYIKNPNLSSESGFSSGDEGLGGYGINSGDEIVNIAVRKMMLSLEDPRYQLQANELTADKR